MYKTSELEQFADRVLEYTSRYNSRQHVSYGPSNLSGKYTKYPSYGDFPETYTLRTYGIWWKSSETSCQKNYMPSDVDLLGAEDFVTIHFNQAVLPTKIYIYETYTPGSIVRIWGRWMRQKWTLLWEGESEKCLPQARKFQPQLKKVSCFVDTLKLEINCSKLDHHICLDAVLLSGRPVAESAFQMKCYEAFTQPQMATVTTICDNTPKVKRKNLIQKLPSEVMHHIFQFLDLKSLCRCARVCKSWYELVDDSLLYQNISLKRYWNTVDGKALDFLMKKCKSLKKLDLSWCGNEDQSFPRKFYQLITSIGENLTHLSLGNATYINGSHLVALNRCPELIELRLRNVHIYEIELYHGQSLSNLKKLINLDFYSTNITNNLLIPMLKNNPKLKYLNIDFCDDINSTDEIIEIVSEFNKNLIGWSSWKTRNLTSKGVGLLGECYQLEDLDLGWGLTTSPPDNSLEKLSNRCKKLKRLILAGWRSLTDQMLLPIIENCKYLEQLDLLSIKGITMKFIEDMLPELPNLKLLELSFCDSISLEKIKEWRILYPNITIQKSPDCEEV